LHNADFESIFARIYSALAVTPGKKVQLTLLGSPLRSFSNEPKTNSIR